MNKKELNEIIDSYKWIKVKKHIPFESGNENQHYKELMEHHTDETTFLISKCREMANEMLVNRRLTDLLIKEVAAFYEGEGYSPGLTEDEMNEMLNLIKNYEKELSISVQQDHIESLTKASGDLIGYDNHKKMIEKMK